jgi:uncharacterized SAM-binding protein YcdF (DUF218 family)
MDDTGGNRSVIPLTLRRNIVQAAREPVRLSADLLLTLFPGTRCGVLHWSVAMSTSIAIALLIVFVCTVYLMKGTITRTALRATAPAPAGRSDQDDAIPVDGIRYVSYVDAQAQPDSGGVLLLAHCVNRSVYRATISRETAKLIRDRLSQAIAAG